MLLAKAAAARVPMRGSSRAAAMAVAHPPLQPLLLPARAVCSPVPIPAPSASGRRDLAAWTHLTSATCSRTTKRRRRRTTTTTTTAGVSTRAAAATGWGGDDDGSAHPPVPWLDSFDVRRSSVADTADNDAEAEDFANSLLGGAVGSAAAAGTLELQRALASHLSAAPLDAVIVLAGGLLADGGLPPWVTRRLDAAAGVQRLQARCRPAGENPADARPPPPIVLSGGGTPHKRPPVDPVTGHPLHESTACARYLMRGGGVGDEGNKRGWAVPPSALLKETASMDTLGNAYFSLLSQAVPFGWRRVAVVTSAFHLPRAKALFVDIWGAGAGSLLGGDAAGFELTFVGARDDPGLFRLPTRGGSDGPGGVDFGGEEEDEEEEAAEARANNGGGGGRAPPTPPTPPPTGAQVLAARRLKELQSVVDWKRARREHGGLSTLPELSRWLHATHRCYSARYQDDFGKRTIQDEALLASY